MIKVLIFVDEANAMAAAAYFNRRMDWPKLRDYLADEEEHRILIEMAIYVGLPPTMEAFAEARNRKLRFLHHLRTQGFLVVTKDGSPTEEGKYKANVDVLMAIDAMEMAVDIKPDVVVLVTGDSDFAHLASKLRRRGMRVEVASMARNLSNELKAAASDVIDLTSVFNEFEPLRGEQAAPIGTDEVFD